MMPLRNKKSLEVHKPDYVGKIKIKKSEMGQNLSAILVDQSLDEVNSRIRAA
jgi:hypothetical protein